ncbi:hypothetical protein DASC09_005720 [Saccharomycopsis crataegensis]|uniref:Zn(2)-C6 fungal-type domain-containing protein n=1 Tax=Saccharomycopsis crataegensis TaxID=43959 RepID=A0AAV5QF22_9ASCO|nr:hypothetical protein DASC09_005720 [Saccharomycopsis crataegensis]
MEQPRIEIVIGVLNNETEPTPPKKPQTRRKHSNSKYGCLQCKKRRIKCDQSFPQCKHCMSYRARELRCSYMDLTEEQKQVILEANKKMGDDAKNPGNDSMGSKPSPIRTTSKTTSLLSKFEKTSGEKHIRHHSPATSSSSSPTSTFPIYPTPTSINDPMPLPGASNILTKFRVTGIRKAWDDERLIQAVISFVSKNLKMPIVNAAYTRYFELIWNIWGNTTIGDASGKSLVNYYTLISWASKYLSTGVYLSVRRNSMSQLGKNLNRITKPLENIALTSNGVSLSLLTDAINKNDYRLLIDLMTSNIFVSNSNYGKDNYIERMTHLNGLVAVIYELYCHKSTIYVPLSNTQEIEDLTLRNAINELYPQEDNEEFRNTDGKHDHLLSSPDHLGNLAPGYSYFNNFTARETVLIKFFEWQIYYGVVASFLPPYNHHCLYEFRDNFISFRDLLCDIEMPLLVAMADNLWDYLQYLIDEIFPILEQNGINDHRFFTTSPKIFHSIYMKYLLMTPPETFVSTSKSSNLSLVERILYRYYINLGKILDHIFPQVRYLFIFGFITTYTQYSDDQGHVLEEGLQSLLKYGTYDKLFPKSCSNRPVDELFKRKIIYHIHYCSRVFGFFRSRNMLLHQGIFFNDPFPESIKNDRLRTRKVQVNEIQITSFGKTFIHPRNFPHVVDRPHSTGSNCSGSDDEKPVFKGMTISELESLNPKYSQLQKQNVVPAGCTVNQIFLDPFFQKDIDIDGNIVGFDFSVGSLSVPIMLKHLVGRSVRDFYDDRSAIFNYFAVHDL